jgi:hypothetical protein
MDLPDEVLEEILQRVPPRRLAACRRVCRSWRAAIDGRGLVLAHLAPGPVRGMFVNFTENSKHGFFSRAYTAAAPSPSIDGSLLFLPNTRAGYLSGRSRVLDHCNGLLLYEKEETTRYVCNPATRRWATLPPRPPHPTAGWRFFFRDRLHLVFDPAVSLHYRVMFFPEVPDKPTPPHRDDVPGKRPRYRYELEVENVGSMKWPPRSYALQVYSSETGRWEERCFLRQGDAVTTVSAIWSNDPYTPICGRALRCYAAVYWQGAFYLNWPGGFIMR